MIVKIQKSLDENSMLIYTEDREIMYEDALSPDINSLLGDEYKGYFEDEISEENQLLIGEKVEYQDW